MHLVDPQDTYLSTSTEPGVSVLLLLTPEIPDAVHDGARASGDRHYDAVSLTACGDRDMQNANGKTDIRTCDRRPLSRCVHSLRAEQFRPWAVRFSVRAVVLAECSLVVLARSAQDNFASRQHACGRRIGTAHPAARQSDTAGRHSRRRVVARRHPGTPATNLVLARRSGARRRRVSRRA